MTSQINAIGIVQLSDSGQQPQFVANYLNDKTFNNNVLNLVSKPNFNIRESQVGAFELETSQYVFVGGSNNIIYYVVTKHGYPTRTLSACMDELKLQYMNCVNNNKQFNKNTLLNLCKKYDDPTNVDKLAQVTAKVNAVKSVMQQNIEVALANCVKLEDIEKNAEELQLMAGIFRVDAKKLRSKMWWKEMKMKLIIAFIILAILGIIIGVIVGMSQQNSGK